MCVDSRLCLTDTSKLNSTLGTFSGKCPEDFGNTVENKMSKFAQFFLQVPALPVYREKNVVTRFKTDLLSFRSTFGIQSLFVCLLLKHLT